MMKRNNIFLMLFTGLLMSWVVMGSVMHSAQAQGMTNELNIRGPLGDIDPDAKVDAAGAKKFYQNCVGHLPVGFTPSTRDDFCTCASVSITQVMTNGELDAVLGAKKRGDSYYDVALIKYVDGVASQCMENPVRTLAYISCLEERAHDHRIRSFPAYCSCAGDIASRMMRDRGPRDMVTHYTGMESNAELRPVEAFIKSPAYRRYVYTGMQSCIQPAYMEWR
jgi:hypothetical protein